MATGTTASRPSGVSCSVLTQLELARRLQLSPRHDTGSKGSFSFRRRVEGSSCVVPPDLGRPMSRSAMSLSEPSWRLLAVAGWAASIIGLVVWIYGYSMPGTPSLIQWVSLPAQLGGQHPSHPRIGMRRGLVAAGQRHGPLGPVPHTVACLGGYIRLDDLNVSRAGTFEAPSSIDRPRLLSKPESVVAP